MERPRFRVAFGGTAIITMGVGRTTMGAVAARTTTAIISHRLDLRNDKERQGTKMILCRTCLDYFGLTDKVEVGAVGEMTDIIAALRGAVKVVSV